jgi:cytochrome c553
MGKAVKFLNDEALVNVAAYYASLTPARPSTTAAAVKPSPVEAGKKAAQSCGGCHGETGVSKIPGMPSLVGLDPKYLVTAMRAYNSGQRKDVVMKALVAKMSDAEMNNVALYYALQEPARAQTPSPGDQAAGKTAAASCGGCHGDRGVSTTAVNPSLAGQDAQYLVVAMDAYKTGARQDDSMKGFVVSLDDATKKNLAAYYASQQPAAQNVRKPLTVGEWTQRCDRCHGLNGNSVDPHIPALAGQREDYLMLALKGYRMRERKSAEMAAMSDALSGDDIENLAAHYSRQEARSVLYVVVPGR